MTSDTRNLSAPPLAVAWWVWSLGALFYLMGFFQRVAPAVMTAELMRTFNINAGALGNLSAFYFYSYVAMQIPTGIIADLWGPRRLLTTGAFVAAAGTAIFALAPQFFWAGVGRFLIGGSVAVAFVGLLKLSTSWFAPRYYAMVSGVALFFGIMGAVFAGTPLRLMMNHISWRMVILMSAGATFAICAAIWTMVRDFPHEKGYADLNDSVAVTGGASLGQIVSGIFQVCRYRNTLLMAIVPGGIVGCVLTFCGLWGVPFLTTHHGMTTSRAAALTSTLLVAWAAGGPLFGWWSDRMGRRKPLFIAGLGISLAGWVALIYTTALPAWGLVALALITGFSSGAMIICFAYAKESVPTGLSGTVSGVVNMGVMAGPMVLQPLVGWMLDLKWEGAAAEGVRIYGLGAYRAGFALMVGWLAVAFVLLLFTRETYCRQQG